MVEKTWNEAVARWRAQGARRAPSTIKREAELLAWMAPHLDGLSLSAVTTGRLSDVRHACLAAGWSNRSTNYATGTAAAVMRAAQEWEWCPHAPRLRALPLPPHRVRWLTAGEADRLLDELPAQLADMARFTLESGLRKATLLAMRWEWVDWTAGSECLRVPPPKMKGRRPLIVPLSRMALAILRRLWPVRSADRVWGGRGEPGARCWRAALVRAGIDDFRWHDLRHTWASWHVQAGTTLAVLKELGGWQTMQMVMVYAHLATRHLFDAVRGR